MALIFVKQEVSVQVKQLRKLVKVNNGRGPFHRNSNFSVTEKNRSDFLQCVLCALIMHTVKSRVF